MFKLTHPVAAFGRLVIADLFFGAGIGKLVAPHHMAAFGRFVIADLFSAPASKNW